MGCLRASLGPEQGLKPAKKSKKATGQKERRLPIYRKKPADEGAAKKTHQSPSAGQPSQQSHA
jgi:hypothetical protein